MSARSRPDSRSTALAIRPCSWRVPAVWAVLIVVSVFTRSYVEVMDEARHVEVFSRYLDEKLGASYPINANLRMLLDEVDLANIPVPRV